MEVLFGLIVRVSARGSARESSSDRISVDGVRGFWRVFLDAPPSLILTCFLSILSWTGFSAWSRHIFVIFALLWFLGPFDLVESNIPVLHSLIEKGCEFFFAKKSLNVPNVKMFSILFFNVFGSFMPF